jgi:cytochrome P450
VLGKRTPTFADLLQLPYARGVFQEALRMYPPSYWIPRTAVEDDEIDGYRIPAGSMVAVLTYTIHYHPEVWEDPKSIDPERFLPKRSEGRHKQAWLPFGAGQRLCIGKDFSLMQGQMLLARVMQRYNVAPIPGRAPTMVTATTMRFKDGVWVRISEREGSKS